MSNFDLWVKNCEKFGLEIWRLEGSGDAKLYVTKEPCMQDGAKYYSDPIYHVWKNDKWLMATLNYVEALETWRRCQNG